MKVRVKLFAAAKELAGSDAITVDVPTGTRIADVRTALEEAYPALKPIAQHALWAIDAAYAAENTTVNAQSEIALIPPVSGG